MLKLEGISFAYPECAPVLEDISFEIGEGEKVVLLGCNGSGKSTLLKLINGLIFPSAGSLDFRGQKLDARTLADRAFSREFRRHCVLLFQNPDSMLFNATVRDEIAFGLEQLQVANVECRVKRWAEQMGLLNKLDREPFRLSGGEKQKLCLACLLALEPELLLLDEPTAQMDPRSTGWLVDFLQDLPVTTLVTTHNLSLAQELGARCLILSEDHRLIFDGNLADAIADQELMIRANLVHIHKHEHDGDVHRHYHTHDWD